MINMGASSASFPTDFLSIRRRRGKVGDSARDMEPWTKRCADIYGLKPDRSELGKDPRFYKQHDAVHILSTMELLVTVLLLR